VACLDARAWHNVRLWSLSSAAEEVCVQRVFCPRCRFEQSAAHTFCPRCGAALPADSTQPASAKAVRYFAATKVGSDDPESAFLRVSSYRRDQHIVSPEGSVTIPGHHVRFSVWVGDAAVCALSLPESEARELGEFLIGELAQLEDPRLAQ
jgi:hypothetical protein